MVLVAKGIFVLTITINNSYTEAKTKQRGFDRTQNNFIILTQKGSCSQGKSVNEQEKTGNAFFKL